MVSAPRELRRRDAPRVVPCLGDATVGQADHAVGHAGHGRVVRDHHHRGAQVGAHLGDDLQHALARGVVQRAGGLVAQQHRRLLGNGAGDGHALLLAARELRRKVIAPRQQAHAIQRLIHGHGRRGDVGHQRHVLGHREAGDEVVELEDEADVLAAIARERGFVGAAQAQRLEPQVARAGHVQPAQQVQQRGLAAARGAEHHQELAARDVEVDVRQRADRRRSVAIDLAERAGAEQRRRALRCVGRRRGGGDHRLIHRR